jgi:hypothetical protein
VLKNTRIVKIDDEKIDLSLNPSIEYRSQDKTTRDKNMKHASESENTFIL